MLKNDRWIKEMSVENAMIAPFEENLVKDGVISYGLSSYGYDIRLADTYKIFRLDGSENMDPKNVSSQAFEDYRGESCIIPAHSYVLARSLEYFKIPRKALALCLGKSTYARMGIIVNVTPLEPEWEGYITMEISNTSPNPVKVYSNEGIAQLVFFESEESCLVSYRDRKGKYQGQKDITLPCTTPGTGQALTAPGRGEAPAAPGEEK
jgi:dCTP deaminase